MTTTLRVLALSGSLRRGSYNTAALRAAQELAPNGMTIDIVDIAAIPMFDQDVEQTGWPYTALDLAANVTRADALLIASTEYNHSFSAPIKNALDWLSRTPPGASAGQYVLARKPVAVLGASTGRSGSGRAQLHLRQVLGYLDMLPVNQPEVLIDHASVKFDGDGHLTDARTRVVIRTLLEGLDSWTRLVGGGEHPIQLARTGADVVHVRRAGSGPSYAVAGDNYIIKAGTADTGGTYAAFEFFVPPGGGPPPHTHYREFEGFYILEGELTFYVGVERLRMTAAAGDFVAAPLGVVHQFSNESSTAPARAFVIAAPAGVEEFFAAAGQPMPDGSQETHPATADEIARLVDLGPQYGISIEQADADGPGAPSHGGGRQAPVSR